MANLRDVLDLVEAHGLRPDAFVFSGDLADAGGPPAYKRIGGLVEDVKRRFGAAVVFALGNHDKREDFRVGYLAEAPSAEPYHHVIDVAGLRVITLDSSVPGQPHGAFDAAQLDWLRDTLREPAPRGTLLAFHHAPVPGPLPVISDILLRDPQALAAVIRGSDVIGILTGHAHHATWATLEGIPCASAASTAYTADPLEQGKIIRGIEGPGFGLIQLYGRTMVSTAITLPSLQREVSNHEMSEENLRRWSEAMRQTQSTAVLS
jgi:3',5'-cyclic AMP phosphodiesterase CpdA